MSRKQILVIALMILGVTCTGIVLVTFSPVWITLLMISPRLINPVTEKVNQKISQQVMGMMFSRRNIPTMPSRIIP